MTFIYPLYRLAFLLFYSIIRSRTSADIDIVCALEYNAFIAGFTVDVQDDQSAKSFVTPCRYAGRFLR